MSAVCRVKWASVVVLAVPSVVLALVALAVAAVVMAAADVMVSALLVAVPVRQGVQQPHTLVPAAAGGIVSAGETSTGGSSGSGYAIVYWFE